MFATKVHLEKMPSFLEKIKSISQWEKDLAIGYTREAQKLVRPNTIPMPISYLCLLYVYESEYFHSNSKEIRVNDQKDSVKAIIPYGTAYGVTNIPGAFTNASLVYSWTFQILDVTDFRHPLEHMKELAKQHLTDEQCLEYMKAFAAQNNGRLPSLRAMMIYFKRGYLNAARLMKRYAENNNITVKFYNSENPKNKCKHKTHTYCSTFSR